MQLVDESTYRMPAYRENHSVANCPENEGAIYGVLVEVLS